MYFIRKNGGNPDDGLINLKKNKKNKGNRHKFVATTLHVSF